jgi:MYXO-CTERM domain-containing protein
VFRSSGLLVERGIRLIEGAQKPTQNVAPKGVPAGTRRVTLTAWRGGCELEMAVGRTYVVYASQPSPGVLTTNICSRTRERARAAEDLAAFSAPAAAPAPPASHPANRDGCTVAPGGGRPARSAGAFVAVALVALAARRRSLKLVVKLPKANPRQ